MFGCAKLFFFVFFVLFFDLFMAFEKCWVSVAHFESFWSELAADSLSSHTNKHCSQIHGLCTEGCTMNNSLTWKGKYSKERESGDPELGL